MASSERGRCAECGFPWDIPVEDALAMVVESADLVVQALGQVDPATPVPSGVWSPNEYLWHMVDVLRIGTERLWTLAHDADAGIPAWDENDLARVRRYDALSGKVGLIAYARAVDEWAAAARSAPPEARALHSERGPVGAHDIVRSNAHEAQHHLLDMEQAARRRSANVFIARSSPPPEIRREVPDGSPRTFDDYVMVDWSANSTPRTGKDSIWIASGSWSDDTFRVLEPVNPATRVGAMAELARIVDDRLARGRRVMMGFDFPFAYPAGLVAAYPSVFGAGPAWRAVWRTLTECVEDTPDNANNRWEVARALNAATGCRLFWGCPDSVADNLLPSRDRAVPGLAERGEGLAKFRLTERRAQEGGGAVQSVWKLAYAGSVGSQTLVGIPHLERLRARYPDHVRVWPFEPLTDAGGPSVTLAEIWPTTFGYDRARHPVRDAAQVLRVVEACAQADAAATVARWLHPPFVAESGRTRQMAEEGWIFGVT